jgi:hypothetical protein
MLSIDAINFAVEAVPDISSQAAEVVGSRSGALNGYTAHFCQRYVKY